MSHFLWVEDFGGTEEKTDFLGVTKNVFPWIEIGDFVSSTMELKKDLENHGVYLETSYQDGINFIRKSLHKVDYIVLDIYLPAATDDDPCDDDTDQILKAFYCETGDLENEQDYRHAQYELEKVAGFHIYTKLILEYGFPKSHIQFCSNHGKEMSSIMDSFKSAKIGCPEVYKKGDLEIGKWTREHSANPYSVLRRGIIEGCTSIGNVENQFDMFLPPENKGRLDGDNYLVILKNHLPIKEPTNKSIHYKLFIRTLSHEWESAVPWKYNDGDKIKISFAKTLKIARNWITHGTIFDYDIPEKLVAYLFLINMRAMFLLGNESLNYENKLLTLFDGSLSAAGVLNRENMNTTLTRSYLFLSDKIREHNIGKNRDDRIEESFYFDAMINDAQKSADFTKSNQDLLLTGLFQVFWHDTKRIKKSDKKATYEKDSIRVFYKFGSFSYREKPWIDTFCRHTYMTSFPDEQ